MWRGPRGASLLRALVLKAPVAKASVVSAALASIGALAVACGATPAATFHPEGANPAGSASTPSHGPSQLARVSADSVVWPPFGRNVHIVMPGWLPADPAEVPAVITAKNFLLAFLYAEYRGNRDHRWTAYVAGKVKNDLRSNLAQPDVTTESFQGTILFSQMNAFADPAVAGGIHVSECFDNPHSAHIGPRGR